MKKALLGPLPALASSRIGEAGGGRIVNVSSVAGAYHTAPRLHSAGTAGTACIANNQSRAV